MKKNYIFLIAILVSSLNSYAQLGADTTFENRNTTGGLIYFRLNAGTSGNSFNTDIYFNANASTGFDLGFDAVLFSNPPFSLYSRLVDGDVGDNYAVQVLNTTDLANTTVPLGMNASEGEEITFTLLINTLPPTTDVFLDDTVANTSTLLNTSDYVFTTSTALSGTGRFFLRVFEDTLSTVENNLEALTISALNNTKEILVDGPLTRNTILHLYDIQGRIVLSKSLDSTLSQQRIDVSSLSGGVYVVNVQNASQQTSQKVILK